MFQRIQFPDYVEVHFVKWEKPLKNESLNHYIDRLLKHFDLTKPIVLIGLSFGGVVIQEIAKKINPLHTIIISSISCSKEFPWYFRLAGNLCLHRITPFRFLKWANVIGQRIFGTKSTASRTLLEQYSKESDMDLLKWSVAQIIDWRSEKSYARFFHIHGSNDRLLPLKNKNGVAIVEGGGHFMVFEQAKEVEVILKEQFEIISQKL